jgi:hypothetical protein
MGTEMLPLRFAQNDSLKKQHESVWQIGLMPIRANESATQGYRITLATLKDVKCDSNSTGDIIL